MNKIFAVIIAAIFLTTGTIETRAGDDGPSCYQLWHKRNAIFKRYGYCFKSKRAKITFGNAGCYTSNPKLPGWARRKVNRIKKLERRWCR